MRSCDLLALFAIELGEWPGRRLEFSVRLLSREFSLDGRLCCWLDQPGDDGTAAIVNLLVRLGAPSAVLAQPLAVANLVTHGLAADFSDATPQFRYYRHARRPHTLADDYQGWSWRSGDADAVHRIYEFHFLPETPSGQTPLELVPPALRRVFARLLAEPRLAQVSGFWLRRTPDGTLDQLDLAFPWCPPAGSLAGVVALAELLELPEGWRHLPVRHVAVSLSAGKTEATLYASAPLSGAWPTSESTLRDLVCAASERFHSTVETEVYAPLPPVVQTDASLVGAFYDGDIALWQRVLGADLHYHHGLFIATDEGSQPGPVGMAEAQRRAVTALYPLLPAGGRLYDVGCGWGGPLAMWPRDLGCPSLGITISRDQYRHIAAQGLPVRLGDAETTLPPGRFDCAVLLESLCHIRDKPHLLRVLRTFCGRLVARVNCQDAAAPGPAFGGTMHMISSTALRQMIEEAGWTIRHWRDRRPETLPSQAGWSHALGDLPPTGNTHVEVLRHWAAGVTAMGQAWAANNPLIEVAAD